MKAVAGLLLGVLVFNAQAVEPEGVFKIPNPLDDKSYLFCSAPGHFLQPDGTWSDKIYTSCIAVPRVLWDSGRFVCEAIEPPAYIFCPSDK